MEFKNHCDPTGNDLPVSERFRIVFETSHEMAAAREAIRNATISAMQSGAFDSEMAKEAIEQIESLKSWESVRYTTAERARVFARLLRYGGSSLLDGASSATALRIADELESEAEIRDAIQEFSQVTPQDFA